MKLLKEMMVTTGLGLSDINRIVESAPRRYKEYYIPKRSGGMRLIAQPSRELKVLQRFVLSYALNDLPVHASAMAYAADRNIFDNAKSHRSSDAILKLDFENFFPSIKVRDWHQFLKEKQSGKWTDGEVDILSRVLFWGRGVNEPKCLSIGAPTSPMLSNILLYELDTKIAQLVSSKSVVYTRYADDITISGQSMNAVLDIERSIYAEVAALKSPRLKFNSKKRGVYTRAQRRMVTGLILTPESKISIGRERKRAISSLLHKFSLDQLTMKDVGYLKGMLAFAIANEPDFVGRLRSKYGDELIDTVLKIHLPKRELRFPMG
ncbi:retron St85 family RNA-directed DNA polymerase [uncultured Parvibaculum sp.]|uniref:retron St85 family RNA-directed DNA polymerase n=1 Tax=uncultured Parvibaculum sp. TaxID=291828 RepID=UPI0030ED9775|tara:strand:- start:12335 stop:13297 length:963 start_codon:yes stop_codon:yes gene_type:complete